MSVGQMQRDSLVGCWQVIAVEVHDGRGAVQYVFGRKPEGRIIYDEAGSMYVLLFNPDRPQFASRDRLRGTAREIKSAFEGSVAYYGTYTVDAVTATVTHHVLGSTYPDWIGQELVRHYKLDGRRLTLTTAPFVNGGKRITAVNIFERLE